MGPPSVEHSASSPILQGESQGERAPPAMMMIPNFSIRDFTLAIRKRDIRKTYPFMSAVENAERKGKQVRLLLPSISPRMKREEVSDTEEEGEEEVKAEEHVQVARQEIDPSQEVQPRGNGGQEDHQQEGLALLGTVAEGEGSGQAEDKASDTGVTTEAETEEQVGGAAAGGGGGGGVGGGGGGGGGCGGGGAKEGEEQQQAEQQQQQSQQQQNVCPVCGFFSSHSVTALNAHMDSCLASPSMGGKSHKISRSKHVKMRSITDIMSPRQSDSGSQKSSLRDKAPEKERRGSSRHQVHSDNLNNLNNLNNNNTNNEQDGGKEAQKDVSSGGQQTHQHHHHRQLRSRSRGSTSVPVPPKLDLPSAAGGSGGERWGSRRRGGGAPRSGGECSEPVKKLKLCSGTSADPTNSWTHSISSGGTTDCLSKTQDVVEKSCASTNSQTLTPPAVHESLDRDADQSCSKEVEKAVGERSTPPPLVQASEAGTGTAQVTPAPLPPDLSSLPCVNPPETEPQVELETKEPVPEGAKTGVDSSQQQREKTTPDAPEIIRECVVEAIPVVDVSRLVNVAPPLVPPPVTFATTVQQDAPVYESIISSLRSPAVGNLACAVPSTLTPWKAAVVMASLGAIEVRSGRPDNVPTLSSRSSAAHVTGGGGGSSSTPGLAAAPPPPPPPTPGPSVNNIPPKAPPVLYRGPVVTTDVYQLPSQQATRAYPAAPAPCTAPDRARLVQRPPQVVRVQSSSDRMVIDVEQESLRSQGSGRVERPVIRLLGQNVTVDNSTSACHRDGQGNRNPYGFSVPTSLHSGGPGPGYHTSCCCRSRHEPLAWKNISGVTTCSNVNLGSSSQIPVQGSWRLLPNGTLTQFGNGQVTLQPGRVGMSSLGASQRRSSLPPWLLEAKKQQDAANVIVIDDDDEEEFKVSTESRTIPRASSSGMPSSSRSSQKREGDNTNSSVQRADKVQKVAETDPTASRMVLVPSLVPAWTIATNCNNEAAPGGNASGSRRGATAQEYKARIAMMNINGQQVTPGHVNEQLPVNAGSNGTSGSQPRGGGLVGNTTPPGYVYQFPAQHAARIFQLQGDGTAAPTPTIIAHPGFVTPTALQQQPLVFGRDCQIIQLEGQYLIVNTGVQEQQVLSPQGDILGRSLILCNNNNNTSGASTGNSTSTNTSNNTNGNVSNTTATTTTTTGTTTTSTNNNSDSQRRSALSSAGPEPILVTPVIQHQGNGYVFATPDQHVHHHHQVIPLSVQQLQQLQLQQHQQLSILQGQSGSRDTKGGGSRNSYGVGPSGKTGH